MKLVQSRKSDYISPQMKLLSLIDDDVMLASGGGMEDYDVGKDTIDWD